MQVDTRTLLDCVNRCLAMAANANFSDEEQKSYLDLGVRLRARLMTLIHANFTQSDAKIKDANAKLKAVNKKLKDRLQNLETAANTIKALSDLASVIDGLFQLPFTFI